MPTWAGLLGEICARDGANGSPEGCYRVDFFRKKTGAAEWD